MALRLKSPAHERKYLFLKQQLDITTPQREHVCLCWNLFGGAVSLVCVIPGDRGVKRESGDMK
jgi:hypothetical protein